MHRAPLLHLLQEYRQRAPAGEHPCIDRLEAFVQSSPRCFSRSHSPGHITGSALVISPDGGRVLLTLHRKLGKWLQLGGHADGEPDVAAVARREAEEESGLPPHSLRFHPAFDRPDGPLAFDVDIHTIPARADEPEHLHYDIRYLLQADPALPLMITRESKDLRWLTLAEARQLTDETSMTRQFDKASRLS